MRDPRTIGALSALAAFLMLPSLCAAQKTGNLRAGAAKVDVSPTKDMFPMNGGGATNGQTFSSVHDPIYARALVLDNGSVKMVFISLDAGGVPSGNELVDAVTAELKIPSEHLLLVATHDHSVPSSPAYLDLVKKGVVEAARQANANLQPARIGYGTGLAYVNTNRDQKIGDDYHMGYAPQGPSDKTVAVVEVTNASGDPIAVYANYAVHGVVMYLSHTDGNFLQVTGDLPGWTSNYVEDRLGKNVVALWTSGAAGDQNPLFMSTYNQDAPDVHDEHENGWSILDVESRRLGEEIVRVTKNIQDTTDHVVLWGGTTSVTCAGRQPDKSQPTASAAPTSGPGVASPTSGTKPLKMVDGDPVVIPLELVMVNDIAFAGVSGEVFTEIGEQLKQQSLFDHTMMVTHLPNRIGYIPSDAAYLLPSAMAVNNRLKPGCAQKAIVGAFLDTEKQYLPIWRTSN